MSIAEERSPFDEWRLSRVWRLLTWLWGAGLAFIAVAASAANAGYWLYGFQGFQEGGDQLNYAMMLVRGRNYYSVPDTYPMLLPQTPGLFPLLLTPWIRLFGPKLIYGNLLGLFSLIVTLICLGYAGRKLSSDWIAVPFVWGILLSMPRVGRMFSWHRPDSLAFALCALSMALTVKSQSCLAPAYHRRTNCEVFWIVGAAVAAGLAVLAKQLSISAIIAAGAYLFIQRKYAMSAIHLLVSCGLLLVVTAVAQFLTQGGYWHNIWTLTRAMTRFSFHHWMRTVGLFSLGTLGATSVFAVAALGDLKRVFSDRDLYLGWDSIRGLLERLSQIRLPVVYATVMLALGYGTTWHNGGTFNYLAYGLEGIAVVVGGSVVGDCLRQKSSVWRWGLLLVLTIGQLGVNLVSPWQTLHENWPAPWVIRVPRSEQLENLYIDTAGLAGEVFFDRLTGIAVLQGRPVEVETSALGRLEEEGLWNSRVLLDDLCRARWDYIVVVRTNPAREIYFISDKLDVTFQTMYEPTEKTYTLCTESVCPMIASIWRKRQTGQKTR